jgi:hypothetical protein
MHVFTSITSNYLPKARVLAHSVKRHAPATVFHLLLCDVPPEGFSLDDEPFDDLIRIDDLPIANRSAWVFQHSVVELCTAVKGLGFSEIFRRFDADKVVFLDPDIAVFSGLEVIEQGLDEQSVLLTPHQTEAEQSRAAILDHEVTCLKYGVFNLGFLAVRNSPEGRRFVDWWSARLRDFCYDERDKGLFTDQKWVDLAPAFFPDLGILRQPQLNVSTWNINRRTLTGSVETGIEVNGEPLCFYHFSGMDNGALKVMMEVYGDGNPVLAELRQWYMARCAAMGQAELGERPCHYDHYSNGERVTAGERLLYRLRDLAERFPDPYDCSDGGGYQAWYRDNAGVGAVDTPEEEMLVVMRQELDAIHHSISWRVFRRLTTAYRKLGARIGLQRVLGRAGRLS